MRVARVAAAHDMSGFGRCSLTVAMPILSAMGSQCCPLPTAYLSTHTQFEGFTFLDMTGEMERTAAHWKKLGLAFESIYTGFLGSEEQISLLQQFIRDFRTPETVVLVDPVMGDNGKLYRTYTPAMCRGMSALAGDADLITPNLTEAAILLGREPSAAPKGEAETIEWAERLSLDGKRSVVLTGVSYEPERIGGVCVDAKSGVRRTVFSDFVASPIHGAGDIYSSVLLGALLRGKPLFEAAGLAADFVRDAVRYTNEIGADLDEGVCFEPLLAPLARKLS